MWLKRVVAGFGAVLLFSVGVAAAFADVPTMPTDTTTTSTTTTTTETTTTETTATTTDSTSTTTTAATAPEPTASTTTTPRPAAASPSGNPGRVAKRLAGVTADDPRKDELRTLRRHKKHRRVSKPLKITPPLGQTGYVFPVVGDVGYIDTYGDFRSDIHGKWHHGDDIFAPLGTPIVAVASGTINRVGWRKAGGWRLWVRDGLANQFYYAHLSGYARTVFHSRYVKAGQVIGFVGNTGDAYPRASHLHFEIHPHQLLSLQYDGAVDPTTYLGSWTHLQTAHAPAPMHPRLPKQPLFRLQARHDFRLLLVARDLARMPYANSFDSRSFDFVPDTTSLRLAAGPVRSEATPTAAKHGGSWQLASAVLLGAIALSLCTTALLRARGRPTA